MTVVEPAAPLETMPHAAGRAYWICQFAGWTGFATYVAGAYLVFVPERLASVAVTILLFNGLGCPAATHALRYWMLRNRWLELPTRRFVPRAAAATVVTAALLTAAVVSLELVAFTSRVEPTGAMWTFVAFVWAVAGWILTYAVVQARRRRARLAFDLTVRARDAQLNALRAQLNPHFLFNCLNSLRALIVQDPQRAVSMVTGLGDLLRYALASDRRQLVPLSQELAIVTQYLDLETIRFEERLVVEQAVDPAALDVNVPPMLLQTLVDNAVKHGVATLPQGGVVRITAQVNATHLDLTVANTGTMPGAPSDGFGLRSAAERLQLLYQDRAALSLTSENGETVATLRLPLDPAERTPERLSSGAVAGTGGIPRRHPGGAGA